MQTVERWETFEISLFSRETTGNPFRDHRVVAEFKTPDRAVNVEGFYDGGGVYKIRFASPEIGFWSFRVKSDLADIDGTDGMFECTHPSASNHGPVRIEDGVFRFADGTTFHPLGTTAYAWTYQAEEVVEQSLESFSRYGFNKIRMLVFPKQYGGGERDLHTVGFSPEVLPFEGSPGALDFTMPKPEYFRRFEGRVRQLLDRGIMADVILFHVYDQGLWGIPQGMTSEDDEHYIRYLVARLASFRNVWWSLANEYDLFGISLPEDIGPFRKKDWDRIGELVRNLDPQELPRSIHNWTFGPIYPKADWMTHVSYQHPNAWSLSMMLKDRYRMPVVNDEYQYEGNLLNDYGNCTGELVVKRHWMLTMAGAYGTHGEVFFWPDRENELFWSNGGRLMGESPERLGFMPRFLDLIDRERLQPDLKLSDGVDMFCMSRDTDFYFYFFTPEYKDRPGFHLGAFAVCGREYRLRVYDAWAGMLVEDTVRRGGSVRLERMPSFCLVTAEGVS